MGATITILTGLILVAYLGISLDRLFGHKDPDIMTNTILRDMSEIENLSAQEERFQFGFGWLKMLDWRIVPHDPRFGIVQMRMVRMQITPFIKFTKEPLDFDWCKVDQFGSLNNINKFYEKNLTDFLCPDIEPLEFHGTFSDYDHTYLHFEILECT